MILLLDTSTAVCKLSLIDGEKRYNDEWEAGRELAKGLLGYLDSQLQAQDKQWSDLTGIGVFQGPGSFTGLRIGMTVLNTVADTLGIPIVAVQGGQWQAQAIERLEAGETDHIALPFYGGEANITRPRK